MAYATKYYDYQVAIIFLILLAGMALLALVVGAIYFICVVNMRNNKKGTNGFTRYPSARSTVKSSRFEEWPQQQRQKTQTFSPQQQQYSPNFEGRGSTQIMGGMPSSQGQTMGSYPSPVRQFPVVQELQPDYFQQQGPITQTTVYQQYDQQQPRIPTSYHMSSV
ncbi:hypothetical protein Mgra_00006628 [Meloidogyne graminicola]|uniref:Uncharacterized protein n=1 Tax=Meloidogyne graminicola TaxID=189291 RepID=A0A8S9ZL28_9BILA|nr:hypothetical protein Mgra_00006628 [Meloidogyne graminicola]